MSQNRTDLRFSLACADHYIHCIHLVFFKLAILHSVLRRGAIEHTLVGIDDKLLHLMCHDSFN